MTVRVVRLGPGECSAIETGARYFATLAFPGMDETADYQDAVSAWVASCLHAANRTDRSTAPFVDNRLKKYLELSPRWCRQKLRRTRTRLRDRYVLARALRPWVREVLQLPNIKPFGTGKFTQEKISLKIFNFQGDVANNFRKRAWRPGLPVAHIAIASDLIFSPTGMEERSFACSLDDLGLIESVVTLARHMEDVVCSDRRFKVAPDSLLHLDWVA